CWGANGRGYLGDGTTNPSNVPVQVIGINDALNISAGGFHACALRNVGNLSCWGGNVHGELGDGTAIDRYSPAPITLPSARAISLGNDHSCALLSSGQVTCWGWNDYGQLGDGSYTDHWPPPTAISGLSGVTEISAGEDHTCALLSAGSVSCWGRNNNGQLGDGTNTDH